MLLLVVCVRVFSEVPVVQVSNCQLLAGSNATSICFLVVPSLFTYDN